MDPLTALVARTAAVKATDTLLKEVLGFQDRQEQALQSIAERLSAVEDSVNVLLQGPHRTARTWLSEAATSSEDQEYKLRRAREYLYEAYSLATTPLTQAAIARETALLLTVLGSVDAQVWWRKAVQHAHEAMAVSAEQARALVGVQPPNAVTAAAATAARRTPRMIGGFRLTGPSDQERFWALSRPHRADLERGRQIGDEVFASLPATRAITGAFQVAAFFKETRSAAKAAGIPDSELPDVKLQVKLHWPGIAVVSRPRRVPPSGPELSEVLAGAYPDLLELSVARLLDAIPNIGATRRKSVYRDSGLSARRRLSALSPDEVSALDKAIRDRFSKAGRKDVRLTSHQS